MPSNSYPTSFDRAKLNVLLLEGIHPGAEARLREAGYASITCVAGALKGAELHQALDRTHLLGIRSRTQLTDEVLQAAPRLIAAGCFCIGTNQVDLTAATGLGIPVFNAPFSNTRSVAELVLAEAIVLLRKIPLRTQQMHQGIWEKSASNSYEVRGKTLGVVGYGNIGAQLGVLAESLGMRVVFYDVLKKLNLGNAEQLDSLDALLKQADVVSLHVPESPQTEGLMSKRAIAAMKPTAVLINASRGRVVDLEALAEAIQEQRLAGAAIDVYPEEPKSNGEPFSSPLRGLPNVILSPHIGGSTVEAQANIGLEVAEKLIRYSDTGTTLSAVNFPEVALPEHPGQHRLLHIHHNRPGVLTQINERLSSTGMNISGQYLQTNSTIGYVVTDVESAYSSPALEALRAIPGTIKARVLF